MAEKQEAQKNMNVDSSNDEKVISECEGPPPKKLKSGKGNNDFNVLGEKVISDINLKSETNVSEAIKPDLKPKIEKNIADTPKREKSVINSGDDIPVPEGWKRLSVQRMGGVSAGKFDIYYISPLGKKLRSRKEITTYCEKESIEIDIDEFIFNAGRTPGRSKKALDSPSKSTPTSKSVSTPKSTPVSKSIPIAKCTPTSKNSPIQKNLSASKSTSVSKSKDSPSAAVSAKKSPSKKENIPKSPKKLDDEKKNAKKRNSSFKISSDGLIRAKLKPRPLWIPPKSPFSLFQESLYDKPWQLLAGTILLGKSSGGDNTGMEVLQDFLKHFPTPEVTIKADPSDIAESLSSLASKDRTAKIIIKFSEEFLTKQWTFPKELHGIGKFGNDSYRVFCLNEWKKVKPSDYLLNFYVDWLWDNHVILNIE